MEVAGREWLCFGDYSVHEILGRGIVRSVQRSWARGRQESSQDNPDQQQVKQSVSILALVHKRRAGDNTRHFRAGA